jgi:hypothetical protein
MNQRAPALMRGAPSQVGMTQLRELHTRTGEPPKAETTGS